MREIEAVGGQAFEVTHENGLDVVMIRDGQAQRVETERLGSDFAWTWARFDSRQEATPSEFVLFAGTSLELEGQEILRSGRPIDYLVASRRGDQFRVETNEGVLDLQLPVADFEAAFAQLTLAKPN